MLRIAYARSIFLQQMLAQNILISYFYCWIAIRLYPVLEWNDRSGSCYLLTQGSGESEIKILNYWSAAMRLHRSHDSHWNMSILLTPPQVTYLTNQLWFYFIFFHFALEFNKRLFPSWINLRSYLRMPHAHRIRLTKLTTKTMRHNFALIPIPVTASLDLRLNETTK